MCFDSVSKSASETQPCRFVDSRTMLLKALTKVSLFIEITKAPFRIQAYIL